MLRQKTRFAMIFSAILITAPGYSVPCMADIAACIKPIVCPRETAKNVQESCINAYHNAKTKVQENFRIIGSFARNHAWSLAAIAGGAILGTECESRWIQYPAMATAAWGGLSIAASHASTCNQLHERCEELTKRVDSLNTHIQGGLTQTAQKINNINKELRHIKEQQHINPLMQSYPPQPNESNNQPMQRFKSSLPQPENR